MLSEFLYWLVTWEKWIADNVEWISLLTNYVGEVDCSQCWVNSFIDLLCGRSGFQIMSSEFLYWLITWERWSGLQIMSSEFLYWLIMWEKWIADNVEWIPLLTNNMGEVDCSQCWVNSFIDLTNKMGEVDCR